MTVPLIRTQSTRLTPANQAFILEHIPEPSLVDVIRIGKKMMVSLLFHAMVQGGLIDVFHENEQVSHPGGAHDLMAQWLGRAAATTPASFFFPAPGS